ncbi:hypothetical protein SNEBB_003520 [Seison nebaliae]|nr:hypothetical protein SNEBB_003520 [Seison nebaliae]
MLILRVFQIFLVSYVLFWLCSVIYDYVKKSCAPVKIILAPKSQMSISENQRNFYPKFLWNDREMTNIVRCQMNNLDDGMNWTTKIENEIHYSSLESDKVEIYRAIIVHFDLTRTDFFLGEFKGLYRSWLEMQRYEPLNIHTDILVFANCSNALEKFNELGCYEPTKMIPIKKTLKTEVKEQGNCYCINYLKLSSRSPIRNRDEWNDEKIAKSIATVAGSIPSKAPFNLHPNYFPILHKELISVDSKIPFVDLNLISQLIRQVKDIHEPLNSINIAYEGYPMFRNYDLILKSDLDTFITPQFGTYLPPLVQMNHTRKRSFVIGTGGYSNYWNSKKLRKIMKENGMPYIWYSNRMMTMVRPLNETTNMTELARKYFLKFETDFSARIPIQNFGATWYGSSDEVHLVGAVAMRSSLYLFTEEFSPIERAGTLGVLMWPDWHYAVLSMYASHMAIMHLTCTELNDLQNTSITHNSVPIIIPYSRLNMLDGKSTDNKNLSDRSIYSPTIHIHSWHTENLFSKFKFKVPGYCSIENETLKSSNHIPSHDLPMKLYALRMACDSNNTQPNYLSTLFKNLSYKFQT